MLINATGFPATLGSCPLITGPLMAVDVDVVIWAIENKV